MEDQLSAEPIDTNKVEESKHYLVSLAGAGRQAFSWPCQDHPIRGLDHFCLLPWDREGDWNEVCVCILKINFLLGPV